MYLPVSLALLASGSLPTSATLTPASQILETYADSLTAHKLPTPTKVWGVRPLGIQRGVTLDGALRAPPMLPMHLAGNPFESVWVGHEKQGDLRIDIGSYGPSDVDIALPSSGFSWVVGRTYNSRQFNSVGAHIDSDGPLGRNWALSSQPEIGFYNDNDDTKDLLYLVYRADAYVEFNRAGSSSNYFKAKNGAAGCFTFVSGSPDTWVYTDQWGYEFTFLGFNTTSSIHDGLLWKVVDPSGQKAFIGDASSASTAISSGWDGSGRITTAYDSSDRRYTYSYTASSYGGKTRLESVIAETKSGLTWGSPGTVTEVARVEYAYYGTQTHGDAGDLKTVTITTPLSDAGVSQVRTKLYRYWEGSSDNVSAYDATTNPGFVHTLKYVYDYEGIRRFDWLDSTFNSTHLDVGTTDDDLAPYASAYFEYDSSRYIRSAWFNGQCGCSGGLSGSFNYTFESNGSYSNTSGYTATWATRTLVEKPDGSYLTQYFDELGQGLSAVVSDIIPTGGSPKTWCTSVFRDGNGCTTEIRMPDNLAASGYNHSTGALTPRTGAGLIRTYERTSSGDLTGFLTVQKFKEGSTAANAYYEAKMAWDAGTLTSAFGSDVTVVRPIVTATRAYPTKGTSDSGYEETTYATDYFSSHTPPLMPETVTTTLPAVATGNNGSGSGNTTAVHYLSDGTLDYRRYQDGRIDYQGVGGGTVTTEIEDADTSVLTEPTGFTSTGTPLARSTTTSYDAQGRITGQTLFATDTIKRNPRHYVSKLADRRLIQFHFTDWEAASPHDKYFGPVRFEVVNQAGRVEASGVISVPLLGYSSTAESGFIDESKSDPLEAIDLAGVGQMSTTIYNESGTRAVEDRAYFLIPGSGAGSAGTNYDATTYGFDGMGRRWRMKETSGTIYRTVFDAIGRPSERWTGTNDHSFSGGEASTPDNMVKVRSTEYDGGADNQNSLISKTTAFIEGSTTGKRETQYLYDLRGRRIVTLPPTAPFSLVKYDNEGRVIATGLYSSSSGLDASDEPIGLSPVVTNRMALSETVYDEMGRIWKSVRHQIDQGDGSDDDTLNTLLWRDPRGRVIKVRGEEYKKTAYDRLGRFTDEYLLAKDNDTANTYSDVYASYTTQVAGDIVLEQYETRYDQTKPDVLMSVAIQRAHSDVNTGSGETTGTLDLNSETPADPLKLTATDVKGRAQITANWHDRIGRLQDSVQYGTNGATDFDRDGLSVPSRSITELRTTTVYNTDGTVQSFEDPNALKTLYVYDALGRRTREVTNWDGSGGTPTPSGTETNVSVVYGYTNGLRTSLTADLPSPQTDQVTTYTYGTAKGTSPGDSKFATGHLLQKITYPDSGGAGDAVTLAYNAQGQVIFKKDQAGNILESTYDDSGRRTGQEATTIASGFDTVVHSVANTYDSLGRRTAVVQYDGSLTPVPTDGVLFTYDNWGQIASYSEDKDSGVSGGGNQYTTSYSWTKNAPSSGRYTVRKTDMTMPDTKVIDYQYRSSGGLHDAEASRVSAVVDGSVALALYDYLGVGTVVRTRLYQISCMTRVFDDSSPPGYVDLDRFNRITTSRWTKDLATDRDFYSVALTYDCNSNITSTQDNVHGYYNNVGMRWDVKYTMDGANRLTEAKEGTLSGGTITNTARDEQWTLSHTGNWDVEKLDLDGDLNFNEAGELNDHRTHNGANELTARDTDNSGSADYSPAYDAAGNMTDDAKDYKYTYDVWGRLRTVSKQDNTLIAEYRYNGLNHRIGVHEDVTLNGTLDGSDAWYYDVFDESWRQLARYVGGNTYPLEDFVPHQAGASGRGNSSYIDLVICRNKNYDDTDGTHSLEERTYICQNWRADVSALVKLVSTSGTELREWDKYSAYGTPLGFPGGDTDSDGDCDITDRNQVQTWINGSTYDVRGDLDLDGDVDSTDKTTLRTSYESITLGRGKLSASNVVSRRGYAGYEVLSGLQGGKWLARNRVLAADLGAWLRRDPIGYAGGTDLYQAMASSPVSASDPLGLQVGGPPIGGGAYYSDAGGFGHNGDPDLPMVNPVIRDTDGDCCRKAREKHNQNSANDSAWEPWGTVNGKTGPEGKVICCPDGSGGTRLVACSFAWKQDYPEIPDNKAGKKTKEKKGKAGKMNAKTEKVIGGCITTHERYHAAHAGPEPCKGIVDYGEAPGGAGDESDAAKPEIECLRRARGEKNDGKQEPYESDCGSDEDCQRYVDFWIESMCSNPMYANSACP